MQVEKGHDTCEPLGDSISHLLVTVPSSRGVGLSCALCNGHGGHDVMGAGLT